MIAHVEASYTIGEFARLTGLTERALHINVARDLLKPASIDETRGYRHYTDVQLDDGRSRCCDPSICHVPTFGRSCARRRRKVGGGSVLVSDREGS